MMLSASHAIAVKRPYFGGMAKQDHEVRFTFRVDASLKQQCERIAAARDESVAQVLRRCMREYAAQYAELATSPPLSRKKK